jgi:hypothetical protein
MYGSTLDGGSLRKEQSSLAVWGRARPRGWTRRFVHAGRRVSRRWQTGINFTEIEVPESVRLRCGLERTLSMRAVDVCIAALSRRNLCIGATMTSCRIWNG